MRPAHAVLPALLAMLALAAVARAAPPIENKWRLQFSGGARSDGRVVIAITPVDSEERRVAVAIARGTGENAVARAVRDGLRREVGDDYRVEVDDGEDVLVKRRFGRAAFNVRVVEIDVRGVRVNLDQE